MDMRKDIAIIGVLALIIIAGAILFQSYSGGKDALVGLRDMGRDEGVVTLSFGESAKFGDLIIEPTELIEDSRCAEDVVCVWAGTVRVGLRTVSGLGTSVQPIELGKSMTTEAEEVRFVSATKDYHLTFEVRKRSEAGSEGE